MTIFNEADFLELPNEIMQQARKEDLTILGRRMEAAREEIQYTREIAAELIGISPHSLKKIEWPGTTPHEPSILTIAQASRVYRKPSAYLLGHTRTEEDVAGQYIAKMAGLEEEDKELPYGIKVSLIILGKSLSWKEEQYKTFCRTAIGRYNRTEGQKTTAPVA